MIVVFVNTFQSWCWARRCILNINSTDRKIILKYTQNNKLEPWLIYDFWYLTCSTMLDNIYTYTDISAICNSPISADILIRLFKKKAKDYLVTAYQMWKRASFLHFISLHAEYHCDLCLSSDKSKTIPWALSLFQRDLHNKQFIK